MSDDIRTVTAGSFTATGQSAAVPISGLFNVSVSDFGTATVAVERSFDNGSSWLNVKSYTAAAEEIGEEVEYDVVYRLNCSAYTSGTIKYRLSQ